MDHWGFLLVDLGGSSAWRVLRLDWIVKVEGPPVEEALVVMELAEAPGLKRRKGAVEAVAEVLVVPL